MVMNTDGAKPVGELAARTWVLTGRGWVVRVTAGTGWGRGEWAGARGRSEHWPVERYWGRKGLRGLGRTGAKERWGRGLESG